MVSIGEFSRVTTLTVKTLRYYHREGILPPAHIDVFTGYRYYDGGSYIRALQIAALKQLGFSIREIKRIVTECSEAAELQEYIDSKRRQVQSRIRELRELEQRLIDYQQRHEHGAPAFGEITEGEFFLPLFACIPLTGRYHEIGAAFSRLSREVGPAGTDAPYGFFYDLEYTPETARFDAVLPVEREIPAEGIEYREFPGRHSVRILHRGFYGSQGNSYLKLFGYCRSQGYTVQKPLIEHYLHAPDNTENEREYLTELICIVTG